ncbi:MAG: HNH endonuclease signature motif containing protein, partial [Acidimicrobiia bacterium]
MDILEGQGSAVSGVRRGVVDLHVDLDTLVGLNDRAGELAGYGPVVADIARKVAANGTEAQWRYTVTDPDTGTIIDTGTTRRRPTARQRRDVQARDRTCVFPGCRMPALASDLDHRIPWAETRRTTTSDLAPLCRHCHRIRHRSNWQYRRLPDATPEWTTKTGRTYVTRGRSP